MTISKYFITTPIFYVNAKPHIGHLYTVLIADAQNRFQHLKRNPVKNTLFTTGTDEHGLKIQQAAENHGFKNPSEFCDQISNQFKETFDKFGVQPVDFIRTTDERHVRAVQHFWRHLHAKGFLTKQTYQSWYCVQDESFLTQRQVDEEKKISLESGRPVEWAEEENYVFPLENFRENIKKWLLDQDVIQPSVFNSNLSMHLDQPLPNIKGKHIFCTILYHKKAEL